ncbi:MAG TPA: hypothetical protein VM308_02870 [Sphingomicrobium sp.]|nr:hypothetical protein [Sphingomicrobium sp.]
MIALLMAQLITGGSGIPQAIPVTSWSCEMITPDGGRYTVAGTTPKFPRGADPNGYSPILLTGNGPAALAGNAMVSPGDASEWFREFQVSSRVKDEQFHLQLDLRKEGSSIAHATRYVSGWSVPYEYHSVGLCRANFAPAERG